MSFEKQPKAKPINFDGFGSLKRKETAEMDFSDIQETRRVKIEQMKHCTSLEKAEEERHGISTNLSLGKDMWKEKKKSTKSGFSNIQRTRRFKTKRMKHYTSVDKAEETRHDISTDLTLYEDPWKVKKRLTKSDLNNLSRFMLKKAEVEEHLFVSMSEDMIDAVKNGEGIGVNTKDINTGSEHRVVFKQWHRSSNSYVINGNWRKDLVRRRVLNAGDEVGLFWDKNDAKFYFGVLDRVKRV